LVFALGYNQEKDFNGTVKFDGFNSGNNSMIQDLTSFNEDIMYQLYLSYPLYDASNNYIKDTTVINGGLNQSGSIFQKGNLNTWSFSGAVEVGKDIFIGATVDVLGGNYERNRQYREDDINNIYSASVLLDPNDPTTADFQGFYLNDIISWDISGWGAKVGLLMKANDQVNIGATVKFPRQYTIKETYYESGTSYFAGIVPHDYNPSDSRVEYDISTPYEFSAGVAYNYEDLTLSGDATFIDYTQMEFRNGGLGVAKETSNNLDIKDLFRSVANFNGGIEYALPMSGISVRGGFMYRPSPFKGDPSEYDKKFVTAGIGFTTNNRISINLAYVHGWWKDFGDNYSSGVSRFYQDINRNNVNLSFVYNFN
jgi:hypothetical protein